MIYKIQYKKGRNSAYPCVAKALDSKGKMVDLTVGVSWADAKQRLISRLNLRHEVLIPEDEYYEVN